MLNYRWTPSVVTSCCGSFFKFTGICSWIKLVCHKLACVTFPTIKLYLLVYILVTSSATWILLVVKYREVWWTWQVEDYTIVATLLLPRICLKMLTSHFSSVFLMPYFSIDKFFCCHVVSLRRKVSVSENPGACEAEECTQLIVLTAGLAYIISTVNWVDKHWCDLVAITFILKKSINFSPQCSWIIYFHINSLSTAYCFPTMWS